MSGKLRSFLIRDLLGDSVSSPTTKIGNCLLDHIHLRITQSAFLFFYYSVTFNQFIYWGNALKSSVFPSLQR